jgi:hypothetical protein
MSRVPTFDLIPRRASLFLVAVGLVLVTRAVGCGSRTEEPPKPLAAPQQQATSISNSPAIEKPSTAAPKAIAPSGPTPLPVKSRRYVTIDNVGPARVLSAPGEEPVLGRIPALARTEIFGSRDVRSGALSQTWYKVKVDGRTGWISQYTTTGEIVSESESGASTSQRAAFQSDPLAKRANYSFPTAQQAFREWTLRSGGVTWVHFESDHQIWVTLSAEKYAMGDLKAIAQHLARAYVVQTDLERDAVVTVWNAERTRYLAKGWSY